VISPRAALVIGLLLGALLPAVGAPCGAALFVYSFLLYRREPRAPWDRAVARLGLLVSTLSLITTGVVVTAAIAGRTSGFDLPDLAATLEEIPLRVRIIQIAVLVGSVVLHEMGHAAAARISGDPTAAAKGRLSPNPLRHLDPFGSVILPIVLSLIPGGVVFGWAKPVPVDPRNYRHPRRGDAFVSVAGVGMNVLLALSCSALVLVFAFVLRAIRPDLAIPALGDPFQAIPAAGLPGGVAAATVLEILKAGVFLNLFLAGINLVPIPPLDGSHLLALILPKGLAGVYRKLGRLLGLPLMIVLLATGTVAYAALPGLLAAYVLLLQPRFLLGV
jgi:Zn-dependent protease